MRNRLPDEIRKILYELILHKRRLIVVGVSGLVLAAAETKYVMSLKDLIEGMEFKNQDLVIHTMVVILALAVVKGFARFIHVFQMNLVGEMVAQNFRQNLQSKFMTLSLSFHNGFQTGSGGLMSRVLNDIVVIQHGLRMFADIFREPFTLLALISWLFYLDWRLTSLIILILPMILGYLKWLSKGIKNNSLSGQEELERITGTLKESLDGVRIIQSFNLEVEMTRRFSAQANEFLTSRRRIHRSVESSGPITEFVMTVVILAIVLYMTYQVAKGQATYGVFVSYGAALLALSPPVKKLQESYVRIQEVMVAARRAYSLIDSKEVVPVPAKPKDFPKDWSEIRFEKVRLKFAENEVLKGIDLTVKRGEVVAFVGASGSGKSSLVNLLERFFDPDEGDVKLGGVSVRDLELKALRSQIALVSQDVFLFSDTIERNIWSGDFDRDPKGVVPAAQSAYAHDFILKQPGGYQQQVGDRGGLLSGGEKQRISIARAFFKDAPILILDEATSALDTVSEIEVQKGIESLMQGRTVLVIAHRLTSIAKAHRIIVLKEGRIVEQGSHKELIEKNGEYCRLYHTATV